MVKLSTPSQAAWRSPSLLLWSPGPSPYHLPSSHPLSHQPPCRLAHPWLYALLEEFLVSSACTGTGQLRFCEQLRHLCRSTIRVSTAHVCSNFLISSLRGERDWPCTLVHTRSAGPLAEGSMIYCLPGQTACWLQILFCLCTFWGLKLYSLTERISFHEVRSLKSNLISQDSLHVNGYKAPSAFTESCFYQSVLGQVTDHRTNQGLLQVWSDAWI